MTASLLSRWILASRPKTLIATVAPVSIGAAFALKNTTASVLNLFVALSAAIFIQIGTNLSNDYFDFKKGADNEERVGPIRVTQSGLISAENVRRGFILCFILASILGSYLIYETGIIIFFVGIASLICGLAYTAGPWPLAYLGLGELFVLMFFGPIASGFTYYVITHGFNLSAFVLGLAPGLVSCGILVANNLRDVEQDAKSNKRTLAVRFGKVFAKAEYILIWIAAYTVILYVGFVEKNPKMMWSYITIPLAFNLCRKVVSYRNLSELIGVLEGTAKTLALFTVILVTSILL